MRNDEHVLIVLNSEEEEFEIQGFDRFLCDGLDKDLEHAKREGA